jgi:hypothetical protein
MQKIVDAAHRHFDVGTISDNDIPASRRILPWDGANPVDDTKLGRAVLYLSRSGCGDQESDQGEEVRTFPHRRLTRQRRKLKRAEPEGSVSKQKN